MLKVLDHNQEILHNTHRLVRSGHIHHNVNSLMDSCCHKFCKLHLKANNKSHNIHNHFGNHHKDSPPEHREF